MPFLTTTIRIVAVGGLLCATVAVAADRGDPSDARARYQSDRAACLSGESNQDRKTCLREAGAAQQEARRGGLDDRQAQYERNLIERCDRHPAEDRQYCIRRMNGEGRVEGSVAGGGIYRELTVTVPAR